MPPVPIGKAGGLGMIFDLPAHQTPPEAWTLASNIRFRKDKAEKFDGWSAAMGTPSVAPAFVMNVDEAGDSYWIYANAIGAGSTVRAFNSGSHADISQAGNYTTANAYDWSGTVFQGVPIVNNGNTDPQYWASLSLAQALQDLPNWPANTTCKVIRSFLSFMVALNISDSGGNHIHRVMWSDAAAPGSLPTSWDVTDPTVEANHRDLSDVNSGEIVDGLPLRDFFVIYKKESAWVMRFIGGVSVMSTKPVIGQSGLLARRCLSLLTLPRTNQELHFIQNGIDLGVFDGQGFVSVVDRKIRKKMLSEIDPIYFRNSFTVVDSVNEEAIFAYPMNGSSVPDRAVVWNYSENNVTFRDFVGVHAATGVVETAAAETWASVSGSWAEQGPARWQEIARRRVIIADQINTKLQQLGGANDADGTDFSTRLMRRGLAVVGVDRNKNPIVDQTKRKLVTRIWPKITGAPVSVRVGGEEYTSDNDDDPDGANITWLDAQTFTPGTDRYLDFHINTPFIAVEITSTDSDIWKLDNYDLEVEIVSEL